MNFVRIRRLVSLILIVAVLPTAGCSTGGGGAANQDSDTQTVWGSRSHGEPIDGPEQDHANPSR